MPGWTWKADTSADEVTGHMFGLAAVATLSTKASERAEAKTLIHDIITYIVENGFTLIDYTGKPTRWGIWSPEYINYNRSWSDQRGLNSLQILSWLSMAAEVTGDASLLDARAVLLNATNRYDRNLVNVKIQSPSDDNYSDDELTFLPYFTYFAYASANDTLRPQMLASLRHVFDVVRPLHSDLWNLMYAAMTGERDASVLGAARWNLETWPLELVDWPTTNTDREDIWINPEINRSFQHGTASVRVLAASSRNQLRWNGDPHQLDGGGGMSEGDPGAWLLPYWLGVYHGLL
jgi:hypothetical protein